LRAKENEEKGGAKGMKEEEAMRNPKLQKCGFAVPDNTIWV